MSQKLSVNNFEQFNDNSQFNDDFVNNYTEESNKGYFLEVDVQYLENLHELHYDFSFLPYRIKKVEKTAANLHDKNMLYTWEILNRH